MAKSTQFDRQEVVDKAMSLYWQKGFHATSMRNLQDEVNLRPGSLYAAFGSKEGLFKEALKNYTRIGLEQLDHCRSEHDSPLEAMKAFVKLQVIDTQVKAPNGMCMLAKTLGELTTEHEQLLEVTKQHLGEISDGFAKLLKQAQDRGEISTVKDAYQLAEYIQVQIAGLRVFAKINNDQDKLEAMIEDIFMHYPLA